MMETNFWGTLNMMKAFYPIINENGRIVNVSGFVSVKAMNKMQLLSRQGKELHSINQSLRHVSSYLIIRVSDIHCCIRKSSSFSVIEIGVMESGGLSHMVL